MTFDQQIKKVLAWNIEAFKQLMVALQNAQSREAALLFRMAKIGVQSNYAMARLLDQMAFIPDDAETQKWDEENNFLGLLEKRQSNVPAIESAPEEVKGRDVKELEHIYNLEEQLKAAKAIEKVNPNWYKEFLNSERKVLNASSKSEYSGTVENGLSDTDIYNSEGSD